MPNQQYTLDKPPPELRCRLKKKKKDCDFWVTSSAHFCACPGQGCLALPHQTSRSSMAHTHPITTRSTREEDRLLSVSLYLVQGQLLQVREVRQVGHRVGPLRHHVAHNGHAEATGPARARAGGGLSARCTWWPLSGVLACVPRCGVSSTCCLCCCPSGSKPATSSRPPERRWRPWSTAPACPTNVASVHFLMGCHNSPGQVLK